MFKKKGDLRGTSRSAAKVKAVRENGLKAPQVLEAAFRKQVIKTLESKGWYIIPVNDRYRKGTPDIFACKFGEAPVWIEFKTDSGVVSGPQEQTIKELLLAGVQAIVLRPSTWFPERW
ncbi:MAG TPA: hypothetical protein VLH56_11500 [Dissulfurispiraceae bacterium]|nr:hypothetical protein [Dissulfurispiraceae bacterium]